MSSLSWTSCWAFDVDGVLADTREAVYRAYAAAGVEQPEWAWGLSWRYWLPALVGDDEAPNVHALKQQYYETFIEEGAAEPLPGATLARALADTGHHVHFVTAASQRSAQAVLKSLGFDYSWLRAAELTDVGRIEQLVELKRFYATSRHHSVQYYTYVDDREEGAEVAGLSGWSFAHAQWML